MPDAWYTDLLRPALSSLRAYVPAHSPRAVRLDANESPFALPPDARAVLGDRRAVHFMRKFYPWYLTGEDVPQQEVAALLVMEDLDEALGRLRHLAGSAPLASARGLN